MKRCIFCVMGLLLVSAPGFAQSLFIRAVGDTGNDNTSLSCLVEMPDKGYIIVGYTYSFGFPPYHALIVKFDSMGNRQWAKTYRTNVYDNRFNCAAPTQDGGFIVGGFSSNGGYARGEAIVAKFDGSGNHQWSRFFKHEYIYEDAHVYTITQLADGNYVISGIVQTGWYDVFFAKLDSAGNFLWHREIGGVAWEGEYVQGTIPTLDGGYLLLVSRAPPNERIFIKFNSAGMVEWSRASSISGSPHETPYQDATQLSDSSFIIVGSTNTFGAGGRDVLILKLDNLGNFKWAKAVGGTGNEEAYRIILLPADSFVIAGSTTSYGAGNQDILLAKFDSSGTLQWATALGDTNNESVSSLIQASDGSFVVAGMTNSFGAGNNDILIAKYSSEGISACITDSIVPVVTSGSLTFYTSLPMTSVSFAYPTFSPTITLVPLQVEDPCGSAGTDETDSRVEIQDYRLEVHPNPFVHSTVISYQLPTTSHTACDLQLTIRDISGRLVREFTNSLFTSNEVVWDGTDTQGKRLRSGIYFLVLTQNGKVVANKKILLLR